MKGILTDKANTAIMGDYEEKRDICLVPCHVTFASLNRVKFYREFNLGYNDNISYLEKEAQLTISKLKTSSLFSKGIIEKVTADINKTEQIIYFDVIFAPRTAQTSLIELLGCLK